jgi:hypothetical protein
VEWLVEMGGYRCVAELPSGTARSREQVSLPKCSLVSVAICVSASRLAAKAEVFLSKINALTLLREAVRARFPGDCKEFSWLPELREISRNSRFPWRL